MTGSASSLMDYRNLNQQFDRVVSVGMFEHVGVPNYSRVFQGHQTQPETGRRGAAALDRASSQGPSATNPWIAKYIFPGGYSPALSEVLGPIEKSGLVATTDIEILRLHYAKTLAHWRFRFAANRDAISTLYDERFCRMFEFYLSGPPNSPLAVGDHINFQIQLVPRSEDVAADARLHRGNRTRDGRIRCKRGLR